MTECKKRYSYWPCFYFLASLYPFCIWKTVHRVVLSTFKFTVLTLSCLSLTLPKSQKCRKLPYGGLAAVSPFVLRGLRLRAIAARAPAFPKRADSSRAGRGCPLLSRLQTPPRGMACRSARYLAYHMKAPDGPLDWPTVVRTSPQPRICSRQCLPMLYTLSKTPTQFPDYIAGRTRDG